MVLHFALVVLKLLSRRWLGVAKKQNSELLTYYIKQERQCFIGIFKYREEGWKYDQKRSIFDKITGVWIAVSSVEDIFSIETKTEE